MGFELSGMFVLADFRVGSFGGSTEEDLTDLKLGITRVKYFHLVDDHTGDDATVRAFDKPIFVDASEAG